MPLMRAENGEPGRLIAIGSLFPTAAGCSLVGTLSGDNRPMRTVVAICMGACLGALARWRLGLWLGGGGAVLAWGILAANLVGGYLVGVCVAVFQALPQLDAIWRLALITGFLGALTTFSGFSIEVVEMLLARRHWLALGSIALHLLGSLGLTWLGLQSAGYLLAARP